MTGRTVGKEYAMLATIQRWGNSQGIRIPKILLASSGLSINDRVELTPSDEGFTVQKAHTSEHRTIVERLETFYGQPISEIPRTVSEGEIDWGEPMGSEVW